MQKQIDFNQKQIDHLIKLVGLTYDELDRIDATLTETGIVLSRPRKRARVPVDQMAALITFLPDCPLVFSLSEG